MPTSFPLLLQYRKLLPCKHTLLPLFCNLTFRQNIQILLCSNKKLNVARSEEEITHETNNFWLHSVSLSIASHHAVRPEGDLIVCIVNLWEIRVFTICLVFFSSLSFTDFGDFAVISIDGGWRWCCVYKI